MISVSADPKRFICALGPGGWKQMMMIRRASTVVLSRCFATRVISVLDASPASAVQLHHGPKHNLPFLSGSRLSSRKHSTSVKTNPVIPKANVETTKQDNDDDSGDDVVDLVGPRPAAWWTGKAPKHGLCPGVEADGCIYSLPQLTFAANANAASCPSSIGNQSLNAAAAVSAASAAASASALLIKKSLQDYFDNTWTMTEVLLSSLQGEEAFQLPPYHDLRHPMIFYYGHPGNNVLHPMWYVLCSRCYASRRQSIHISGCIYSLMNAV
jgi:hypothetical protein